MCRVGHGERRNEVLLLTRDAQHDAAADEHRQLRACVEQRSDRRGGGHHLFEIVENEQHGTVADMVDEAVHRVSPASVGEVEGLRHGRQHQLRIGDRGQLDEEDPTGVVTERAAGNLKAESRLARASGPGQREQPVIAKQLADLGDFAVTSEEAGKPGRQIVRSGVERAQSGKVVLHAGDDELPEMLGMLEVLQPMLAEVAQIDTIRQRLAQQRPRRRRDQDLPAMADARDAAGPMDVEADVGLRREARLPGMETDPDADFAALRPRLGGQRALRPHGCRHGAGRGREGHEEGVALGADLHAVAGREGLAEQLLVTLEQGGPAVSLRAEQAGRALDVAEEEGDGAGQELGHSVR